MDREQFREYFAQKYKNGTLTIKRTHKSPPNEDFYKYFKDVLIIDYNNLSEDAKLYLQLKK